jgi:four helix bundle protein
VDALQRLEVWKRACRLSVNLYNLTKQRPDLGFRDQVTRSALSIASNIAEGYERDGKKDRIRFLRIVKGSCGECWTQLLIGSEAGFIDGDRAKPLIAETEALSRMIRGLIKYFELESP